MMWLVLLPALAFIVSASALERNRERSRAEAELITLARLAADRQQQSLAGMQRTVALMAKLAPVQAAAQGADSATCSAGLAEAAAPNPQEYSFAVWKSGGDLACAIGRMPGPANAGSERWFRQVVAQRAFSIGDFQLADPQGPPVITVGYPITSSTGQWLGVISSALDLSHLTDTAAVRPLPSDALTTLFDHNGTVLARSAEATNWDGKTLPNSPSLIASLSKGADVIEAADIDGAQRVDAFATVTGPGGDLDYLSVGRPPLAVYGPADTALAVGLAITAGLTVLAMALAGWWSRQTLVRPMQSLLAATDRLERGDLAVRAKSEQAGSEVDRLAAAFNAMADRLEQSDAERSAARATAEQATQQAHQVQARAAQLEAVSAGLSMPLTAEEVISAILRQGAGSVGASAATLLMLSHDGTWLKQVTSLGYSDPISRLFQKYPVSSPLPPADVVRTGEAVWIESAAAYRARYPQMTDVVNSTDYEAAAAIPLRFAGRVTGVLAMSFSKAQSFTDETQTYLITLASLCAQALERVRLYEETYRLNSAPEGQAGPGSEINASD